MMGPFRRKKNSLVLVVGYILLQEMIEVKEINKTEWAKGLSEICGEILYSPYFFTQCHGRI